MGKGRASLTLLALACPSAAFAHASEQSFVLLLPTGAYIAGGLATVILTVIVIARLPTAVALRLFRPVSIGTSRRLPGKTGTSLLSLGLLVGLVWVGLTGSHDPTRNPLVVAIWTVFWVIIVLAHGFFGNLWAWVNPWTGALHLLRRAGVRPVARLASTVGHWPALVSLMGFAGLLLIHPKANDPDTLAQAVIIYWTLHFCGGLVLGPRWLRRGEAFGVILAAYANLAPFGLQHGRRKIGLPGWQWLAQPIPPLSVAVMLVALLSLGSFEGLYETFFWFKLLGLNPLEFAGRSSVVGQNGAGLIAALPLLITVYSACLWAGVRLAQTGTPLVLAFRAFAPALLPIAFGYHLAHYLPSLLVDGQSIPIVLTDPWGTGADLWGYGHPHVSTGFFNRLDTVRLIWLAQAGAVVAGHVIAILMSHAIALRLLGGQRRAALSQLPMAGFMIGYTLFGLWLLTSPQA